MRTIKRECINKMILFGEQHVRHVVEEYVAHYNEERPHSGIDHNVPAPSSCDRSEAIC